MATHHSKLNYCRFKTPDGNGCGRAAAGVHSFPDAVNDGYNYAGNYRVYVPYCEEHGKPELLAESFKHFNCKTYPVA